MNKDLFGFSPPAAEEKPDMKALHPREMIYDKDCIGFLTACGGGKSRNESLIYQNH
ncbi:MAG: hypothetical protein II168_03550 [Ruminococcus sp.]|nr:hypothetical protein [Ruminococcus sp.]